MSHCNTFNCSLELSKHVLGICNFGMLNYFLGKRAADEGRESRYPHIDFCKDPGAICSREEHPELKWIGESKVIDVKVGCDCTSCE